MQALLCTHTVAVTASLAARCQRFHIDIVESVAAIEPVIGGSLHIAADVLFLEFDPDYAGSFTDAIDRIKGERRELAIVVIHEDDSLALLAADHGCGFITADGLDSDREFQNAIAEASTPDPFP